MTSTYTIVFVNELYFKSIPKSTTRLILILENDQEWKEEYLTNLTELTHLEFRGMGKIKGIHKMRLPITSLSIRRQGLTEVPDLTNLVNLTHLDVSENAIYYLNPLIDLDKLTHLYANKNRVHDLCRMPKLQHLEMDYNRMGNLINISGSNNLKTLKVNYNNICPCLVADH